LLPEIRGHSQALDILVTSGLLPVTLSKENFICDTLETNVALAQLHVEYYFCPVASNDIDIDFFGFFLKQNLLQKIPPHTVLAPSTQAHWQAPVSPALHWF
jgi:hypothetical protein